MSTPVVDVDVVEPSGTGDLPAGGDAGSVDAVAAEPAPRRWRVATCVALRFCVVYFGLYVLTTQMLTALLGLSFAPLPNLGELPPVTTTVSWVARNVVGVTAPLVITGSGSGDKTFDWTHVLTVLLASAAIVTLWSIAARRREHHVRLHRWFHVFLRFALGASLVQYGVVKAIPMQMPAPSLTRLLEPFGQFSPMGVLWASIGASPSYEIFTGCMELLAGVLLFVPRTATLGALLALAVTTEVFVLNMTYDVPVKLFSFHLILMAVVLIAPECRRLVNVLILNRSAGPSTMLPPVRSRRAIAAVALAQIVVGVCLTGVALYGASRQWTTFGGGAPKSPLYGIWEIEWLAIDGVERAPLVTDFDRWRRAIFDRPAGMSFQRMNETFVGYPAKIDTTARTIALSKPSDAAWKSTLSFDRPAHDRLALAGDFDGHKVEMRLVLVDVNRFVLKQRGFSWIQEFPFNR